MKVAGMMGSCEGGHAKSELKSELKSEMELTMRRLVHNFTILNVQTTTKLFESSANTYTLLVNFKYLTVKTRNCELVKF